LEKKIFCRIDRAGLNSSLIFDGEVFSVTDSKSECPTDYFLVFLHEKNLREAVFPFIGVRKWTG